MHWKLTMQCCIIDWLNYLLLLSEWKYLNKKNSNHDGKNLHLYQAFFTCYISFALAKFRGKKLVSQRARIYTNVLHLPSHFDKRWQQWTLSLWRQKSWTRCTGSSQCRLSSRGESEAGTCAWSSGSSATQCQGQGWKQCQGQG